MAVSTVTLSLKFKIGNSAIIKLIRRYEYLFNRIAKLEFKAQPQKGRPTIYCELEDKQIVLLLTLMKNSNKKVIEHKFNLAYFGSLNEEIING